jgi:hypothetical protein
VAGHDGTPGQDGAHVRRGSGLTLLRAKPLQVVVEHGVRAEQALDAHRRRDVRRGEQPAKVGDGQHQHAQHAVGAVDEGESLFFPQRDRCNPGLAQRIRRLPELASRVAHLALPGERQRAVGERGEISRAAKGAILADDRGDSRRQHGGVGRGRRRLDPGAAGRQRRQTQQHHRADDLPFHLRARARGVTADHAALQLDPQARRNVLGGQSPESGGYTVVRPAIPSQRVDDPPALLDLGQALVRQFHAGVVPGHRDDFVRADRTDADDDGVRWTHWLYPFPLINNPRVL